MSDVPALAARIELLRALAHLAEPPGPAHAALAEALELSAPPDAAGYADLFEFQLYPYASVHLGPEGMLGGEAEARVAGFWRAVGREVPPEPDHLASLIGLYVALAEEEGEVAEPGGSDAQATLIARSRRALLEEHLAPWVFAFLARVEELGGTFHAAWAKMLGGALADEVDRHGPASALPAALEAVEELPDPRADGAKAFLAGLLAPARSGAILTRADLGRIAQRLELGLRAGERRYALEHLMGQDAAAVLEALASEVARQAAAHERRIVRLGQSASFLAARAGRTSALLRTLAEEAEKSQTSWATQGPPEPGSATRGREDS